MKLILTKTKIYNIDKFFFLLFLKKLFFLFRLLFFFPITFCFFLIIILLYPIIVIRIGRFRSDKIGHLSLEYEIYLNETKPNFFLDLWYREKKICNNYLYNIRKKQFNIVPSLIFSDIYKLIKILNLQNIFICDRKFSDSDTNYVLDKNKVTFKLEKDLIKSKLNLLYSMNLKKNQKIVCIHLRDEAYRGFHPMTDYKNIKKFQNYYKTINYLIDKGFFVIRTGRQSNYRFKINSSNFLDYPFSSIKSDKMDVVIASRAYFCISSGSGFDGLVRLFRNPVLFTNFVPIGYFNSYSKKNMTIFKHYKDKNKKKLSFCEILNQGLIYFNDGRDFKKKKITLVENSDKEIFEATKEMLGYIKKKFRRKKFKDHYYLKTNYFFTKKILEKYNFSQHYKVESIIPKSFLKKNKHLLNEI